MEININNSPKFILVELPQNLTFNILNFITTRKLDYEKFDTFEEALPTLENKSNIVIVLSHRLINFIKNNKNADSIFSNYFILIYQFFDDLDYIIANYPNITFDFINVIISPDVINYKIDKFLNLVSNSSNLIKNSFYKDNIVLRKETEQVDDLIQDLEYKLLKTEINKEQLERELELKKIFENEISKLNNYLQEQTIRINDLNKELKSFTYSVTHDIKAPLRGIIGYSQELLKRHSDQLSERAKFCIKQIDKAARGLEELIQDLLSYTKLELENPILNEVKLNDIIQQIINSRINEINKYQTKLNLDLSYEKFLCWERGLVQVISNLLDNAIKYSSKSEKPVVTISSNIINDKILISVKDNGIGFDMKYHDKIFELFHRLADQSVYEGTGAGLAICKRIIDKMKGKIWAESELTKGSTFYVEIPLIKNEV